MKKGFASIRNSFLTGLLLVLPIGISVWIITKVFNFLDSILGDIISNYLDMRIPGLGLVVTLALIYIIGFISNRILGNSITKRFEKLLENIPVLKIVYRPIRKMLSNFASKDNKNFQQVVLVNFPNDEGKSIGFITNDSVTVADKEKIFVFVPTTPNPTNGFLMLYDIKDVTLIDIPVDQALSMVVSLGSSFSGDLPIKQENID